MSGRKEKRGFIALVSAIMITVVILTFATAVSLTGFYGRSNILGSEVREQSQAAAEACVNKAIADLALGSPTTGAVTFGNDPFNNNEPYGCTIIAIDANQPTSGQTRIRAQGVFHEAYTNLQVVVDSTTQAVISWRELVEFP